MGDIGASGASSSGESDRYFAPPSPPSNSDYRHARGWAHSILMRPIHTLEPRVPPQPQQTAPSAAPIPPADPRQITVVGVCSAGKSTLIKTLRDRGYKARAVAQEHSHVPYLWQRSRPDVLIYLDASLSTIRRRRGVRWHQPMLDEERRRLSQAREHADLYIHTDGLSPHDVASRTVTYLNNSRTGAELKAESDECQVK